MSVTPRTMADKGRVNRELARVKCAARVWTFSVAALHFLATLNARDERSHSKESSRIPALGLAAAPLRIPTSWQPRTSQPEPVSNRNARSLKLLER